MNIQVLKSKFSEWLHRQTWLNFLADRLQEGIQDGYQKAGPAGTKVKNWLHGTWLGHPVHPVVTDIPIGAWSSAVTLDLLEILTGKRAFGKGADAAITLGLGGAALAAVSGATDWQHTSGEAKRTGMLHAILNTGATLLFLSAVLVGKQRNRRFNHALTFAGFSMSLFSAYLGGDLVFRQKIGVSHAPTAKIAPDFVPVILADGLLEGKPTRVYVKDHPVLVVRRGDTIYAIAETCAHMGGPLSEGELRADQSVVCPWHASRFDLATGKVLDGPSAYPQPCFEARIQDRQVEIRQVDRSGWKIPERI